MKASAFLISSAISVLSLAGFMIICSLKKTNKEIKSKKVKRRRKEVVVRGWGSNSSGQMSLGYSGPGPNYVVSLPNISNVKDIKQICVGPYHILVLTDNGTVFGCGSNSYSKLCFDESISSVDELIRIECLCDKSIVELATGPSFCLALSGKFFDG